ncbi:class I glutamine amidotransferase-like protein [Abortiporus biennis]|nr:class I glutamine amidotransferase-like protein [Abortiporus biennis]
MTTTLKIAVCLFPLVTASDYQGPIDLLGFLDKNMAPGSHFPELDFNPTPKYNFEIIYLASTKDSVKPDAGPRVVGDETYEDILKKKEQFDILLIPGGSGATPPLVQPVLLEFLKFQASGAKYILSVCTGSWILAQAGLLDGKRATTNKFCFRKVQASTHLQAITWVAKARWVVDGNVWSASGVTAGSDMVYAFLEHLNGEKIATTLRGFVELSGKQEGDDEFAEFYGLI